MANPRQFGTTNKQPSDPKDFGINERSQDVSDFGDPVQRTAKVNVRIFSRAPAAKELGEGEHVYSVVSGVRKLHVKLQGVVVSTTLT